MESLVCEVPSLLRVGVGGPRPLWFTGVWPVVCHKVVTSASVYEGQVPIFGWDVGSWGPGRSLACALLELCWKNRPGQDALVLNRGGLETEPQSQCHV